MSEDRPERPQPRRGLVGRLIGGRYRVLRMVSAGGATLIVDAEDTELARPVTVKLVRPEWAESSGFRRTFHQAMRAMSTLSHPNIAAVYDWGEDTVGRRTTVYSVGEYLDGGSLRDLFDRGRHLDPSQALLVGLEACRGLDFAHRKGLVHTELTPSKLVFGDDRRLRIVDFGLARLLGEHDWSEPATVATHVARYASPEQALGQPLDGKTDVYSLALILAEAVTRQVPFAARSTVATLSARIGRLMPVSADLGPLAAVLERAGRPQAADRSSAAEFGRALVRAAEKLSRPEPIPILASSRFDDDTSQLRRPNDPTGGVARPPVEPVDPIVRPPPGGQGAPPSPDDVATGDDDPPSAAATVAEAAAAATAATVAAEGGPAPVVDPTPRGDAGSSGGVVAGSEIVGDESDEPDEQALGHAGAVAAVAPLALGGAVRMGGAPLGPGRAGGGGAAPVLDDPGPPPGADDASGAVAPLVDTLPPPVVPANPQLYDGDVDVTKDELAALAASATIAPPGPSPAPAPPASPPPSPALRAAEPPAEPSRSRWLVAVAGFLVLALLAGLGFVAYLLFRVPTHEVPALTGLTLEQAEARIAEYEWDVEVQRERSDEEPDEGQVVRVVPDAGSDLADGEPFLIVVSEGPELRALPDVAGLARGEAETVLAELRLRSVMAGEQFDEEVAAGDVVSWSVPSDPSLTAGAEVLPDTEVALVVSTGPAPRTVPELAGDTVEEARGELDELRLQAAEAEREFSNDVPSGDVIAVDPAPGTSVERDSTVTLRVSKGPDLVALPDVTGQTLAQAQATLQAAGLQVGGLIGNSAGTVVQMIVGGGNVEAGSEYLRNSAIDLALI